MNPLKLLEKLPKRLQVYTISGNLRARSRRVLTRLIVSKASVAICCGVCLELAAFPERMS